MNDELKLRFPRLAHFNGYNSDLPHCVMWVSDGNVMLNHTPNADALELSMQRDNWGQR